jgi:DNA-directed RNA polymerase specialized sigma subunit
LAKNVLATVYGLTTVRQVWTHLANNFSSKSRSRCNQLKRQLQTLQQGTRTCTKYLRAAKSLAYQLAIIGNQIDDEDLVSFTLNGLNSSYNTFVAFYSLATRDKGLTF